jgi:serine/threonine protein kinase
MNAQPFGNYQLLKKLATGGMAEVWLARKDGIEGFQRLLVIKRILPHLAEDPEFVQMFLNEAKIAARFNHPNIAQIYDLGEVKGTYFIAMEFVHGEDLGRVMRKAWSSGQWIARPLAIRIIASACEGLHYAHAKTDEEGRPLRVVHRDISPQNILISFDGSVKVVDFGIAKAADQASMTKSGAIKGKFAYMSPEQAAGKPLDQRSDIYALGLVLYELLTGVRPLKRESELATLQAALEGAIDPPSQVAEVPAELDAVVMKALAKAADDRYRDARQFQMALEEFLIGQRWVATSVQVSELMNTLFAERLDEEKRVGHAVPQSEDSMTGRPAPEEREPSQKSGTGTGAMEWEAPPGEKAEGRTKATRSSGTGTGNKRMSAPDVPSWDAPPSKVVPSPRRRATGETQAGEDRDQHTAIARSNSSPELRAATSRPDVARRPPRRTMTKAAPAEELDDRDDRDEEFEDERDERDERDDRDDATRAVPMPTPRRTGSKTQLPPSETRRRPSGVKNALPAESEATEPPKRRVTGEPKRRVSNAQLAPVPKDDDDDEAPPPKKKTPAPAPDLADLEVLKAKARVRMRRVISITVVGALLLTVTLFRQQLWSVLNDRAGMAGQPIYLTVTSNQPVTISVRHKEPNASEPFSVLGEQPLRHASGAHIGDVVVLDNPRTGAHFEQPLDFGQPGETKVINHEFRTGFLKPHFLPRSVSGLTLYLNDQEIGLFPGPKIELAEGQHTIEVRGPSLKSPFTFDANVPADRTYETPGLDLSKDLQ